MPRSPSGASARPSPRVLIKSLERNALHTSRIRDMVRLNGNRSNGVNGAAWLGRILLSSQAKNCRGSLECQPSTWIVHQAAPSKLGQQATLSLLPLSASDQPLRFVMDSPTIHECHSV